MNPEKKMSATPIMAVVIALIVISGIVYVNQRPEGDLMMKKGDDMMKEGGSLMKEGDSMVKEGGMMMKDGEAMMKKDIVVSLKGENASGQTGTATLTDMDGKTKVVITIPAGAAGVAQPAHIHTGACPNPGEVVYPLASVTNGTSETILDVSLDTLYGKLPLAINVHKSKDEAKIYTSCGDLPKEEMVSMMMKKDGGAMMEGGATQ